MPFRPSTSFQKPQKRILELTVLVTGRFQLLLCYFKGSYASLSEIVESLKMQPVHTCKVIL